MIFGVAVGAVAGFLFLAWVRRAEEVESTRLALGLVIAAVIYVGFAAGGSAGFSWIGIELLGVAAFGALAFLAFTRGIQWFALGWSVHVLWDVWLHGPDLAFVPTWYPVACVAFDLMVAGYAIGRGVQPHSARTTRQPASITRRQVRKSDLPQ